MWPTRDRAILIHSISGVIILIITLRYCPVLSIVKTRDAGTTQQNIFKNYHTFKNEYKFKIDHNMDLGGIWTLDLWRNLYYFPATLTTEPGGHQVTVLRLSRFRSTLFIRIISRMISGAINYDEFTGLSV